MPARRPPHRRLWGPLGEGGALCHGRVKHGRSCRTSSAFQHHSPGGCPGDCDLQLHCRLAQRDSWGNLVHDTTTTMPGPCSEKSSAPPRGEGALRRPSALDTWAGWGSMPVFPPPVMAGQPFLILRATSLVAPYVRPLSHPTCDVPCPTLRATSLVPPYVRRPFSSRRFGEFRKGDDPGPPVVPGGQGIGLGSRTLERAGRRLGRTGDGLGPLVCCRKACHKAKRRVGV